MDMILLDWTRMGRQYCLAGAVARGGLYQIVRPLIAKFRDAPVRNVGWSPWLMDGYNRWDVFELIGMQSGPAEPPHLEDIWVRTLQPRRRSAPPDERQVILAATMTRSEEPLFGVPLSSTRAAAYVQPGTGGRSLATLVVAADQVAFSGSQRDGVADADIRVTLPLPGIGERTLAVKDHHLLLRAERLAPNLTDRLTALRSAVGQMGERVAVRLGLSRAFQVNPGQGSAVCWVMADGFFSLNDPQP